MNLPLPKLPPGLSKRLLPPLACVAVCLGAFLSFSIQPLVGKLLLPAQGGSASTWIGTMLFFQAALLLGYSWSVYWLGRTPLAQVGATLVLALTALAATSLGWLRETPWGGLGGILLSLSIATLPAMLLLFSLTPLLHGWLKRIGQPVPYYIFALSNFGGLAAVLLYPFKIERTFDLSDQITAWRGFLGLLVGLLSLAAWLLLQTPDADTAPRTNATNAAAPEDNITPARLAFWTMLSALACAGMLGATHHLAAEIGSGPLVWAGPFGLFLVSYIITFSGGWRPNFTLASFGWLALSLTGYVVTKGVNSGTVDGPRALWLLSLSAAGGFCCNGLLRDTMPRARFLPFYFAIAVGGVLGGLFASLAAPVLFLRPTEFLAISTVILLLGLIRLLAARTPLTIAVTLIVVLAPIFAQIGRQMTEESAGFTRLRRIRNLYSAKLLKFEENAVVLASETTTHGSQLTQSPEARRQPTLYYTESTAVGRILESLRATQNPLNVGVIGLGAGTLAAYAGPSDTYDFWDIDPQAEKIARDYFSFLADSPGKIRTHLADGRKGIATSATDYDLIVIDAFSGDAVPPHLLTYEALSAYFGRLEKRRGLLAIHTSSRYHNFFPVVAATARAAGWTALNVSTMISSTTESRDWDATGTQYIVICEPDRAADVTAWFPDSEDDGRVTRTVTPYKVQPAGVTTIWTDERHGDLDTFKLKNYLLGVRL